MLADTVCLLTRLICGGSIRWTGCVPQVKQRIYFANHASHLDFLAVWSALPPAIRKKTRPVAAKDYWDKGTIRKYFIHKVFNGILIERSQTLHPDDPQHPINVIIQALDEGWSVIIFPEGTRNLQEGLQPFKSGIYRIGQKRPDVELIPVYLENLNRILPKGEFLPIPLLGTVTFGTPIKLDVNETKESFLQKARNAVERLAET